jgi:hypothetical protein
MCTYAMAEACCSLPVLMYEVCRTQACAYGPVLSCTLWVAVISKCDDQAVDSYDFYWCFRPSGGKCSLAPSCQLCRLCRRCMSRTAAPGSTIQTGKLLAAGSPVITVVVVVGKFHHESLGAATTCLGVCITGSSHVTLTCTGRKSSCRLSSNIRTSGCGSQDIST